ncbi:lipopolysaccharide transport periplasmic protein LptA [Nitratifractor salsuginis]|uniref:OstA family protein n=1 Tax=Nitratifractor salsuginis (strain DSM 16511 / JCM 12458 / E9I37-1) TaxID=749222 RepID=E6X358_NITSE|nr:lipopolysaccharide transport periplasmic protein LptA [Nitratifractor salsuginis]ADV46202.1 OstA family protein [Nitratifractor salsuginis DSM 16511]
MRGMRAVGIFLSLMAIVWGAENLEVTADKFTHLEKEQKAIFQGHAHATQGASWIKAKKFVVYFDKENNAKEYQAMGNVNFEIVKKPDRDVKGQCDKLLYKVAEDSYRLIGHAVVDDRVNHRLMKGDEIFLDNKRGLARATSGKKGPVKFVFPMKDAQGAKKKKRGKY